VILLTSSVPATSIRNLTGTSRSHGASTLTVLAWRISRSSVSTMMPGLVTRVRVPLWIWTSI